MENKRKSKINKYFKQLVEEKNDLVDLLERNVNQIFCAVEKINEDDVNQKDLHKFLEYELKLIQKFEEFSFELEAFQDECPFKELDVPLNVLEHESNANDLTDIISNAREVPTQTEIDSTYNPSIETELPTHDTEISLQISGADLQNIRQTLRSVSEKLGLNDQNISSIRNFYAKPLTNSLGGFPEGPSSSSARYLPDEYYPNGTDAYQIPEKDLNPTSHIVPSNIDSSLIHDVCEGQVVSNNEIAKSEESDDCTSSNISEIDSSEESTNCNFAISNSQRHASVPTLRNCNEPCTAIKKLNNLKLSEKKDSHVDIKPLELPDLALKPLDLLETNIQNATMIRNFETQNKKKKKNNVDKLLTFDLKPKDVPDVGAICAFSHIESPSDFYIHLVDSESVLIDKISEDIKNIALNRREYKSKEEAFSDIQQYGVVYITAYANWYRMEVLDWYHRQKHENVLVQLVDYGSKHEVPYKNLGRLTKTWASIPMLAVHCHFPLMYPPNSTHLNRLTQWPQDTISEFMEISGLLNQSEIHENLFKIAYASWNSELNAVEIDLIHVDEPNEEHTVGQILLDLGLAVQLTEDYEDEDAELEEFLQDIEHLEASDNINEAITGYDARDEARLCRFTKADGTCFKGKNCKLEHKLLPKDGYTTDRDTVFSEAMYSLVLPKQGEFVMVLITGYKNICNFFVQIIRTSFKETCHFVDRDFHLLMQEINSPAASKSHQSFKVAPAMGEIVLVKHWSSKWLRGVVRGFNTNFDGEPCNFQVFAVDYGETLINIKPSDLRKIKAQYLQLPFQAVECYIQDYKFRNNCDPRDVKKFFDKNMYFKNFIATIISPFLPFEIILRTLNNEINIGQSLKQQGYAENRTFDINPRADYPLDLH